MDKVFFPININDTHWTLAVADMEKKVVSYYNSLKEVGRFYVNAVLRLLADHAVDKGVAIFQESQWDIVLSDKTIVPQQDNEYDCGLFVITCADYVSDDLPLAYHQEDMPEARKKWAAAILRGSIDY
jgi:sentrin-specific protease 1